MLKLIEGSCSESERSWEYSEYLLEREWSDQIIFTKINIIIRHRFESWITNGEESRLNCKRSKKGWWIS